MRRLAVLTYLVLTVLSLAAVILEHNGVKFLYLEEYFSLKPDEYDTATVFDHVDGDTVKIMLDQTIETVRLIGVDTPETVHPTKPVERFGKAASLFTAKLLAKNEPVLITYDWNTRDKYGRLLGYIWFKVKWQDAEHWILHNLVLILNGFGYAYTSYPFRQDYMDIFGRAEQTARENQVGLWGQNEEEVIAALESGTYSPVVKQKEPQRTASVKIITISPRGKNEYVVIKNVGNVPVNLKGWRLFSAGGQWFTFPSVTLAPGQSVSVHSGPEASGPLIWMKAYVWNNQGDKAILYDAAGNVVSTYEY